MRYDGRAMMKKRAKLRAIGFSVGLGLVGSCFSGLVHAVPTFEVGFYTQFTVVPGSTVPVDVFLRNNSSETISFASDYPDGVEPGIQHLSASAGCPRPGDWMFEDCYFVSGFQEQFVGVNILPDETFQVPAWSFEVPFAPEGPTATGRPWVHIELEPNILGGMYLFGTNLPGFDGRHVIEYTIGAEELRSSLLFLEACVVNREDGAVLSGPTAYCAGSSDDGSTGVPEPTTLTLFGAGLAALGCMRRGKAGATRVGQKG